MKPVQAFRFNKSNKFVNYWFSTLDYTIYAAAAALTMGKTFLLLLSFVSNIRYAYLIKPKSYTTLLIVVDRFELIVCYHAFHGFEGYSILHHQPEQTNISTYRMVEGAARFKCSLLGTHSGNFDYSLDRIEFECVQIKSELLP